MGRSGRANPNELNRPRGQHETRLLDSSSKSPREAKRHRTSSSECHSRSQPMPGIAYLPKPYEASALGRAVRSCLDGSWTET